MSHSCKPKLCERLVAVSRERPALALPHFTSSIPAMDYEQNAHLAAAPAYALESDSESDWDDDELRPHSTTAASKELAPDAVVSLEGGGQGLEKGQEAVFLLGEAGERLAQGVQLDDAARAMKVVVEGEQVRLPLPCADSCVRSS